MKIRPPKRFRKKDNEEETGGGANSSITSRRPKLFKPVRKVFNAIKKKDKRKEKNRLTTIDTDSRGSALNIVVGSVPNSSIEEHLTITHNSTATNCASFSSASQKEMATKSDAKHTSAKGQEPQSPSNKEKVEAAIVTSDQPELLIPSTSTRVVPGNHPRPIVPSRRISGNRKKFGGKENPHFEDPSITKTYSRIPELESTKLPRGGISIDTQAVGRVQFGLPPETIKDSMCMGINVPLFYIVPVDRFCTEMGPALGVNLAEFEFPAYFNFFIQQKKCTLIVDSDNAERNIRRVFAETLLGPAQFRNEENSIAFEEEDFAPNFNREAIPDFRKELKHFRVGPDGKELVIETLLNFIHFERPADSRGHGRLGVPPHGKVPDDDAGDDGDESDDKKSKVSIFSRVKLCEVAVLYPPAASHAEIAARTCKRVEIFKMPGGAEYVIHDINENNVIVGKGKFSGTVKVSASMGVHGFCDTTEENLNKGIATKKLRSSLDSVIPRSVVPPSFHPPSFGVTVLGNSHGFDKSGSVSGYVLWINGRGVMIDPPPYSSATLELEGIRPRTIVGIILTHCHADHDAGAFQKVLTGSPVVVITTPTIYKSFIRKYAALSALSPALLRHSHRHKPAIIGQPLRFQGATFHFTYTLHSIPCVGFRVEWRGRSMVFTGDHLNSPKIIAELQDKGTLSAARAQDLRNLPLQETDLLLHEAGVPPLHTPLEVLMDLPKRVRQRLYVVHTTPKLLEGSDLRVAPTGTAGTIRLDEKAPSVLKRRNGIPSTLFDVMSYEDEVMFQALWMSNEYDTCNKCNDIMDTPNHRRCSNDSSLRQRLSINSECNGGTREPPKVALRPTSSTDAWFVLNLLSAVPFLSGLSYASTMEVLETARVDAYSTHDIVLPAARRKDVLCVVWEGTCMEREAKERDNNSLNDKKDDDSLNDDIEMAVWHAGDWTGPISLQPEKALSGECQFSSTHDIVAMSSQGVKVITVEFSNLHSILKSGSSLYRAYLDRNSHKSGSLEFLQDTITGHLYEEVVRNIEIMDVIESNSTLRKISAVQKRHLESLAEGPVYFAPGERLWKSGALVEKAFIIVGGTVSFLAKRRNAGSFNHRMKKFDDRTASVTGDDESNNANSFGELMRKDAERVRLGFEGMKKLEDCEGSDGRVSFDSSHNVNDEVFDFGATQAEEERYDMINNQDFMRLSHGLQERAEQLSSGQLPPSISTIIGKERRYSDSDRSEFSDSMSGQEDTSFAESDGAKSMTSERRRSSMDRLANKQLVRLYNRRAFTAGLVFSRGHFLGDISKMVAGLLSSNYSDTSYTDDISMVFGFGDRNEKNKDARNVEMTIHEQEGEQPIVHTSTLAAGKDGCVALEFSKSTLIPFFDEHPGLLLSLLGTQVVL